MDFLGEKNSEYHGVSCEQDKLVCKVMLLKFHLFQIKVWGEIPRIQSTGNSKNFLDPNH